MNAQDNGEQTLAPIVMPGVPVAERDAACVGFAALCPC